MARVVLTKPSKTGTKQITGQVILEGIGRITLAVTDKNGNKNIKRFKKSDYNIHYLEK